MKRNKREGKGDNLKYVVKKRLFEQLFQKKNLVEGSHTECLRKDHSWLRKFLLWKTFPVEELLLLNEQLQNVWMGKFKENSWIYWLYS